MFEYDPIAVLSGIDVPVSALIAADGDGQRARALAAVSTARVAAGGTPIEVSPFGHDGHNLMRYRPEAVSASILAVERPGAPRHQ